MKLLRFFATTAKGMESLLAQELQNFADSLFKITDSKAPTPKTTDSQSAPLFTIHPPTQAGVAFDGPLELAYRACLHSRIANRILFPLKTFHAPTPEKLYGEVKSIRWSDHLTPDQTLAVDFTTSHSKITHSHYGALKTKDAICDQMTSIYKKRPSIDTHRPDLRINVYLNQDQATLSIDLSGNSLHQRGYRLEQREAPLKENLAAAILKQAGYEEVLKQRGALVDPMCGSGTLVLEAALMATQTAPGLKRNYFGFLGWKKHDSVLWKKLVEEAESQRITDPKKIPKLIGYDEDFRAIKTAIRNAESAGLRGFVHFEKRELQQAEAPSGYTTGLMIVNPPYGERLGDEENLIPLYRNLGHTMKQRFKGWKGGIFTGSSRLAKEIGLKAARRHILFNGPIECRLLTYEIY